MGTLTRSRLTSVIDFMAPFGTDRVNNDLVITEGGFVVSQRFWDKVEKTETCWNWTACKVRGYGHYWDAPTGKQVKAHRWAYEAIKGPIPDGLPLDHLCRNPACVNPDHLEPVTQRENSLRGIGVCAKNAVKTHCPQGHPYDEANTRPRKGARGGRECRACQRVWRRESKQRVKAGTR